MLWKICNFSVFAINNIFEKKYLNSPTISIQHSREILSKEILTIRSKYETLRIIHLFATMKCYLDILTNWNIERKLLVGLRGLHTNVPWIERMNVPMEKRKKDSAFFR